MKKVQLGEESPLLWEAGEALFTAQNRVKKVQLGEGSPVLCGCGEDKSSKTKDQVHLPEQGEARPVGEKDQCSGLVVKKSASYHRYISKVHLPHMYGEARPVGEKD